MLNILEKKLSEKILEFELKTYTINCKIILIFSQPHLLDKKFRV